ncbi:MAG: redoxin domain-containing protein [Anaerolineales bacterium]|nr:MAG: redoxin domain-containing protein [Anaerolineales bacterium]
MADQEESPSNRKWIIAVAVLLGVTLSVAGGRALVGRSEEEQVTAQGMQIAPVGGALAPDFTLVNLEGENVSLSDFKGQPVLINLWAIWCGPCRIEMPTIQSRFEKYRDEGFIVLAVNFDEQKADVQAFGDEFGLTFQMLLDPGAKVQKLYRTRSYPTSFFVDRKGVIQAQHIGVMTEGNLDGNLAQIGLGN